MLYYTYEYNMCKLNPASNNENSLRVEEYNIIVKSTVNIYIYIL